MTSKDVSSIKNICTEENKAICESKGKLCNPNSRYRNNFCFNNTEINHKKIKDFNDKLIKLQTQQHSPISRTSPNIQETYNVIKTKKTILDFIKELGKRKYKTAKEVIESIFNNDDGNEIAKEIDNNKSKNL